MDNASRRWQRRDGSRTVAGRPGHRGRRQPRLLPGEQPRHPCHALRPSLLLNWTPSSPPAPSTHSQPISRSHAEAAVVGPRLVGTDDRLEILVRPHDRAVHRAAPEGAGSPLRPRSRPVRRGRGEVGTRRARGGLGQRRLPARAPGRRRGGGPPGRALLPVHRGRRFLRVAAGARPHGPLCAYIEDRARPRPLSPARSRRRAQRPTAGANSPSTASTTRCGPRSCAST